MSFLVCLLLVSIEVLLGGATDMDQCCLPVRFEGTLHDSQSGAYFRFGTDYDLGRVFQTTEPLSETFTIVDLEKRISYNFRDGECNATAFRGALFFQRCLDHYTHLETVTLGEATFGPDAEVLQNQDPNGNIRTAFMTRRFDGTCFPLFIHDRHFRGGNSRSLYSDGLSATLSGYRAVRIKSDVTNCNYIVS